MHKTPNKQFRKQATGPFFWLFLLRKLPLAFIAGVKLDRIDNEGSQTRLKFGWINQNPFKSMYFAAMQMAAELASGTLLFQYFDKETRFSMLLVSVEANYDKKAIGTIKYECNEGENVNQYINSMLLNPEGENIKIPVVAKNADGEVVADFVFNWSCRKK